MEEDQVTKLQKKIASLKEEVASLEKFQKEQTDFIIKLGKEKITFALVATILRSQIQLNLDMSEHHAKSPESAEKLLPSFLLAESSAIKAADTLLGPFDYDNINKFNQDLIKKQD